MKHVDAWLNDTLLRNPIQTAVPSRRKCVGPIEPEIRKCRRVKECIALSVLPDPRYRPQQRAIPCILTNVEIPLFIALQRSHEPTGLPGETRDRRNIQGKD